MIGESSWSSLKIHGGRLLSSTSRKMDKRLNNQTQNTFFPGVDDDSVISLHLHLTTVMSSGTAFGRKYEYECPMQEREMTKDGCVCVHAILGARKKSRVFFADDPAAISFSHYKASAAISLSLWLKRPPPSSSSCKNFENEHAEFPPCLGSPAESRLECRRSIQRERFWRSRWRTFRRHGGYTTKSSFGSWNLCISRSISLRTSFDVLYSDHEISAVVRCYMEGGLFFLISSHNTRARRTDLPTQTNKVLRTLPIWCHRICKTLLAYQTKLNI